MEEIAKTITIRISHSLEIISAAVIGVAVLRFLYQYLRLQLQKTFFNSVSPGEGPAGVRVTFGTAIGISLELLLGADVLATAVAPSWDDIGQLAAIAIIRTALNYFLGKELKEIRTIRGQFNSE